MWRFRVGISSLDLILVSQYRGLFDSLFSKHQPGQSQETPPRQTLEIYQNGTSGRCYTRIAQDLRRRRRQLSKDSASVLPHPGCVCACPPISSCGRPSTNAPLLPRANTNRQPVLSPQNAVLVPSRILDNYLPDKKSHPTAPQSYLDVQLFFSSIHQQERERRGGISRTAEEDKSGRRLTHVNVAFGGYVILCSLRWGFTVRVTRSRRLLLV